MMKILTEERRGEAVCLLLLLITGIVLLAGAGGDAGADVRPAGPAGLPRYIGYLLLVLLAVRLAVLAREAGQARSGRRRDMLGAGERGIPRAEETDGPQIVKLLLVALITLIYLAALTYGGFSFTWLTLAFLGALGAALSDGSPRKLAAVAVIAAVMSFALTYIFADVLSVVLPQ